MRGDDSGNEVVSILKHESVFNNSMQLHTPVMANKSSPLMTGWNRASDRANVKSNRADPQTDQIEQNEAYPAQCDRRV